MMALLHQSMADPSSEDERVATTTTSSQQRTPLNLTVSVNLPMRTADLTTTPTPTKAGIQQSTSVRSPSPKDTDRPFQCQEPGCGRRFNRKFTLSEHMKTHTGEKPYVCPVSSCGKRFSTSGNLARHKRLHASIKPFECSIDGCKRSFPNEIKLQQHLKIHMGGKTHMCKAPGCGKSFSTAGNLTRHTKNHHLHHGGPQHQHHSQHNTHGLLHSFNSGTIHPSESRTHHSPVSVANSITGDHSMHSMFTPPTHVPLTSYAHMQPPFHHAPPSQSSAQPSMANLYYSFPHANSSESNNMHSHHSHGQHTGHGHGSSHSHNHGPSHGVPMGNFAHDSFHHPMYEELPVHSMHSHDGHAQSLFDDVIRFDLQHPRML